MLPFDDNAETWRRTCPNVGPCPNRILSLTEDGVRLSAANRDPIIDSLLADALVVSGPTDWLRRTGRGARR